MENVKFHLGCDHCRDENGAPCAGPHKHINQMIEIHKAMHSKAPKHSHQPPLEKNNHLELDTSVSLDDEGVNQCQSLIRILQWTIASGRFDVATAVMSVSGFRVVPHEGHLERVKRICGHLSFSNSRWRPFTSGRKNPITLTCMSESVIGNAPVTPELTRSSHMEPPHQKESV